MSEAQADGRKRILVVDDELTFCEMMKLTLELSGNYRVRTVSYASQVVSVARGFEPHLILLDCMMPSMDGGEVAGALESTPDLRDIPVAFMTATVSEPEEIPSQCYRGVRTYLPKSLPLNELVEFIEKQTIKKE
jgi:CheY-like chemotaxis protein